MWPLPLISLFLLVFLWGETVHAQQDPGADFLKERERERQLERLENLRPGQSIQTPDVKPVEEEVCFVVREVKIVGSTVFEPEELQAEAHDFTGRCLGQKSIGALVQKLTNFYADAGFITSRAFLPRQDISSGILTIQISEGRIGSFRYSVLGEDGKPRPGKARKVLWAFPISPGDVFQLRDVEQGLDQINRLPSSNARVNLKPGEKPGTSAVEITEQQVDLYRGSLTIDNQGSEATGRQRLRLGLEVDDIFAVNDQYTFSYQGSQNTNVLAYTFSVPLGNWKFSNVGSYSESLSVVNAASDLLSQTASLTFEAEKLLLRDATKKIFGYGGFGYFWNDRSINLAVLTPQRRSAVELGVRQERFFENRVLTADVKFRLGLPVFGADDDPVNLPANAPVNRFAKLEMSAFHSWTFADQSRFVTSANAQFTDRPMFSNEQFSIGGWDSVRGYQDATLSGEKGLFVRNDYTLPPILSDVVDGKGDGWIRQFFGNMRLQAFFDLGVVDNVALNSHHTMIGTGFGFRTSVGRASLSAMVASPLASVGQTKFGGYEGLVNVTVKLF